MSRSMTLGEQELGRLTEHRGDGDGAALEVDLEPGALAAHVLARLSASMR